MLTESDYIHIIRALFVAIHPQYMEMYNDAGIRIHRIVYNPYELASREIYKLNNLLSYFYNNGCNRIRLSLPYNGGRDLISLFREFREHHRNDSRMVSAGYLYISALDMYNLLDEANCDLSLTRKIKTWLLFGRKIYTRTRYYIEITK